MRNWWVLMGVCMVGCASTPEVVKAPPVAEDLVGWTAPIAVDEPSAPDRPTLPVEPAEARTPREKVYVFEPGESQRIDVAVGTPLDIVLQPGEEIHNIVGGDREPADAQDQMPRWEVRQGYSGAGKTGRPHVFLAVTKPGLTTSLVITTTKRTYYLDCRSVARSQTRSVRWTYDDEPKVAAKPKPRLLPDPSQPQRYHVGYAIETSDPKPIWAVRQVVDNGHKTYLIFPPTLQTIEAPLLRAVGVNGPELLNSRQVGSVMVLDRIINRVELRIGTGDTAETVVVTRQAPRTISCPGDEACPIWPHDGLAQQGVTP